MCGALNTKSQRDSRHGSMVLSKLTFLGIKLLLTGLQRVHTTWKMLKLWKVRDKKYIWWQESQLKKQNYL